MMSSEAMINDAPLSLYKAELVEYSVGACEYSNSYLIPPAGFIPIKVDGNVGTRKVSITLDFFGDSSYEIAMRISELTASLHRDAELFLPDDFYYTCVYTGCSEPEEKAPWIWQVKFDFEGFRHRALVTERFSASGKMFVEGNCDAPAIITIFPTSSGADTVSVNDITVRNMTGAVVIDGIEKTVMQGGKNKFADTNLVRFPVLRAGYNDITIVGNAAVEISYYPIYL